MLLVMTSFSYSAPFSDYFEDQNSNGNWTTLINDWNYFIGPPPGGTLLVGENISAIPDNVAAIQYNKEQYSTQNLKMISAFTVDDTSGEASGGIFFGLNGSGSNINTDYTGFFAGISMWDGSNYYLSVGEIGGVLHEEQVAVDPDKILILTINTGTDDNINVSLDEWINSDSTKPLYSGLFDIGLISGNSIGFTGVHTGHSAKFGYFSVETVPVPGAFLLLGSGLLGLIGWKRKQKN